MIPINLKPFVLLSGGMDSTTCLLMAVRHHRTPIAISVNYGQRHSRELEHAKALCNRFGVGHEILDLTNLLPASMLTDRDQQLPNMSYDQIEGMSPTYVPFRNATLLSLVTARAQSWCMSNDAAEDSACVYFGAHAEDAAGWAYPDCTPEFIGAMANSIYVGTYRRVRLVAPLMLMSKAEIVTAGEALDVPWDMTWSCYAGGPSHCGTCPTCRARREAFRAAHVADPTVYAA